MGGFLPHGAVLASEGYPSLLPTPETYLDRTRWSQRVPVSRAAPVPSPPPAPIPLPDPLSLGSADNFFRTQQCPLSTALGHSLHHPHCEPLTQDSGPRGPSLPQQTSSRPGLLTQIALSPYVLQTGWGPGLCWVCGWHYCYCWCLGHPHQWCRGRTGWIFPSMMAWTVWSMSTQRTTKMCSRSTRCWHCSTTSPPKTTRPHKDNLRWKS